MFLVYIASNMLVATTYTFDLYLSHHIFLVFFSYLTYPFPFLARIKGQMSEI